MHCVCEKSLLPGKKIYIVNNQINTDKLITNYIG